MTAAHPRPRIVDVAFWLWMVAAVLLVIGGGVGPLLLVSYDAVRHATPNTVTDAQLHRELMFHRGAWFICLLLGLAIPYLAARTRHGDRRFRRAAVVLSTAGALFVALCGLFHLVTLYALLAIIALIVATGLITRPTASAWFDAVDTSGAGNA
jgi:hypothetical protein